jgi:hypothetical protein
MGCEKLKMTWMKGKRWQTMGQLGIMKGCECRKFNFFCYFLHLVVVTTLALSSQPRQGFARVRTKRGAQECGRVWEWTLTLSNELPFWELESWWIPKTSESNCKGLNSSPWGVLYIIEKLLKCRCPKWARMTHLDICNTTYGQKKGRESNQ